MTACRRNQSSEGTVEKHQIYAFCRRHPYWSVTPAKAGIHKYQSVNPKNLWD